MTFSTREYQKRQSPIKDAEFCEWAARCRDQADSFTKIVAYCLEDPCRTFVGEPSIFANAAFACELYLKALLFRERKECRGHDLFSLFNELSPEIQNLIKEKHSCGNVARMCFEQEILKISQTFEKFRYYHESNGSVRGLNAQFLTELLLVLKGLTRGNPRIGLRN